MSLLFREGTWDRNIWQNVFDANEYELPDAFAPDDLILDLGAHIGSFTYTALDRGARQVLAVEPDTDNIRVWRHNLHHVCQAMHRAILVTAAACGNDHPGGPVYYAPIGTNTGGGTTTGNNGTQVAAIPFDALVDMAVCLSPSGRIRLAKLDIEGSEWCCLCTSERLHLIDEVVGEYHKVPAIQRPLEELLVDLRRTLEASGFAVEIVPDLHTPILGKFRGRRS